MNNFDQSWIRLTSAARAVAEGQAVSAPEPSWVTRVAALGRAEFSRVFGRPAWMTWAIPALGVALLVAVSFLALWGPRLAEPRVSDELVALADPFVGGSLWP